MHYIKIVSEMEECTYTKEVKLVVEERVKRGMNWEIRIVSVHNERNAALKISNWVV